MDVLARFNDLFHQKRLVSSGISSMRLATSVIPSSKLRGTSVLRLALYLVGRSSLDTRIAITFGNSRVHLNWLILELLFLILNGLRQLFRTAGIEFTLARLERNQISAASVVLNLEFYL